MKVRSKIIIAVAFVALVPIAVLAFTTLRIHQQAHVTQVRALRTGAASAGAALVHVELEGKRRGLAGIIQRAADWRLLTPAEREGLAWLVYSQFEDIAAVVVVDADGTLVVEPATLGPQDEQGTWGSHPRLDRGALSGVVGELRVEHESSEEIHTLAPLRLNQHTLIPLLFSVEGEGSRRWTIAVLLSTKGMCRDLRQHRPKGTRVSLWDRAGNTVCPDHAGRGKVPFQALPTGSEKDTIHSLPGDGDWLAAFSSTPDGWWVAIEQPEAEAFAASRRIRTQSVLWLILGVLGALAAGTVLARSITKPLQTLQYAAGRIALGDFAQAQMPASGDEFGDVAKAFDLMSHEIRKWNEELQQRVQERTSELRAAEKQLLEAKKNAAMSALSAGISHELNNPLASVVAFAQILLADVRKEGGSERRVELLVTLEKEALRISDIVRRMQDLSRAPEGETVIDLDKLVDAVAEKNDSRREEGKVHLERLGPDGPFRIRGNQERLSMALTCLFDNAFQAMKHQEKKELQVRLDSVDGDLVVLEFRDSGRGIPPDLVDRVFEPFFTDKETWRGVGLGLSLVHRVVEDHRGKVGLESEVGVGTTVRMTFPAAPGEAHLV